MRRRNYLAQKHLGEFETYCQTKGWEPQPLKGDFEVLRMRHPTEKGVLLVHDRLDAVVHYTTEGHSYRLAQSFYDKRKIQPLERVLAEI